MTTLEIGSPAHRDLFCRFFIDSHIRFDPESTPWPSLEGDARARLVGLPFWGEAVSTERVTARTVQTAAQHETDPVVREALALQGAEEGRHALLLRSLTRFYDIPLPPMPPMPQQRDVRREFLYAGYGECFDSFFAFGLMAIAKESGYFSPELIAIFDPIMQEEARHILFFVNWAAYHRVQLPWHERPGFDVKRLLATVMQIVSRLRTARGMNQGNNFTMKGHEEIDADITPRGFLEVCLQENGRRFSRYDPRLLRPSFVPAMARFALRLLRR